MAISKNEEIKVIYKDDSLLILDKPAGWVTTREKDRENPSPTLPLTGQGVRLRFVEDWVRKYYPNNLPRGGIVHRLDKGTSGVLVVARDDTSLSNLKTQFKKRQIIKHYQALVEGDLPGTGNVKMPIIRSKYVFSQFRVGEEGRMAETEFKVIKKIRIEREIYSLVDINLKTGRTHQIRVHLSYLGWPILGDKLYGGKIIDGLDRPFLHAYELILKHPINGKMMKFESRLSDDLQSLLKLYD